MKTVAVILAQTDAGIGERGEKKLVAAGYARNYLLPKRLAVLVHDPKAKEILAEVRSEQATQEKEITELRDLAEKINGRKLVLTKPASSSGKLFGSIDAKAIAAALKIKPNFTIEPIKQIGTHEVKLDFGHNLTATLVLEVEAEAKPAQKPKNTKKSKS